MAISQDKAQELCNTTEWNTLENSFSPKLETLSASVLKKQANRVRRFLEQERKEPEDEGRVALFEEALQRLETSRSNAEEGESDEKLAARREKERAARERNKVVRERRTEVKTKLKEKAEKEKAEKEGAADTDDNKDKKGARSVRSHLQDAAKRSQGKIGSRKV